MGEKVGDDTSLFYVYEYLPPDSPTLSPTLSLQPTTTSTNPEKSFCNIYTRNSPDPMEGKSPWDSDTAESCSCLPNDICVDYGEDEKIQSKAELPFNGLLRADRNCCYVKRYEDQTDGVMITKYCCPFSSVMFFCEQSQKIKKATNIILQVVMMASFLVMGPMMGMVLSGGAAASASAGAGRTAAYQAGSATRRSSVTNKAIQDQNGKIIKQQQQPPPSPKQVGKESFVEVSGEMTKSLTVVNRNDFLGRVTYQPGRPALPSTVVTKTKIVNQDGYLQGLFTFRRLTASGANVMQLFNDIPEDISPNDPRLLSEEVEMDTDREDTIELEVDEQSFSYIYRFQFFQDMLSIQIQWSLLFQETFEGDDIADFNPITQLPSLTESILDALNELELSTLAAYYRTLASLAGYTVIASSDLSWKNLHTQFSLNAIQSE